MKKKILLVCLMFLMTFLMILPVQAKKRVVKAEAYASRMNEFGMVWCPSCGWEKCTLDTSLLDLNYCPKCGTELKYNITANSTFNGYGEIAYKATVKRNKTTIIKFPAKPKAKIKGGFILTEQRIKMISRLSRYRGQGLFKQYGKSKIIVNCKKKTKIMILFQGDRKTLLTIKVK